MVEGSSPPAPSSKAGLFSPADTMLVRREGGHQLQQQDGTWYWGVLCISGQTAMTSAGAETGHDSVPHKGAKSHQTWLVVKTTPDTWRCMWWLIGCLLIVCLFIMNLFVCLFVCFLHFVSLFIYHMFVTLLLVCLFIICLFLYNLFVCLFIVCLFVYLFVCLFIVCLLVY